MRVLFRIGNEVYPVELALSSGGVWRVNAGGRDLAAGLDPGGKAGAVDTRSVVVEVDGRPLRAVVVREGKRWWVAVGGQVAVLEEATEDDRAAGAAHGPLEGSQPRRRSGWEGSRPLGGASGWEVVSPIPGRVLSVLVSPGDQVEAGQVVVSVEAMKMENGLKAERAGRVARVLVAEGDRVEPGQLLVELEAALGAPRSCER